MSLSSAIESFRLQSYRELDLSLLLAIVSFTMLMLLVFALQFVLSTFQERGRHRNKTD
jgi:hypothetical protein